MIAKLNRKKRKKRISFKPDSVFLYAMDGLVLHLPVAYEVRDYAVPHWCPVVIYTI